MASLTVSVSPLTILSFPDEILGEISLCYVYARADKSGSIKNYKWLIVTHICRQWREVALHTPQIWTTIFLTSKVDCIKAMIQRSGQLPLMVEKRADITGIPPSNTFTEVINVIYAEMHRLKSLTICIGEKGPDSVIFAALRSIKPKAARALESLDVTYHASMFGDNELVDTLPLFSNAATFLPSYKRLFLSFCNLRLTRSLLRPSLTHVKLIADDEYDYYTVNSILSILKSLPALIDFGVVKLYGPRVNGLPNTLSPPSAERTVTLPHLQKLYIGDQDDGCVAAVLLHLLIIPVSASILLEGSMTTTPKRFEFLLRVMEQKTAGGCGTIPSPNDDISPGPAGGDSDDLQLLHDETSTFKVYYDNLLSCLDMFLGACAKQGKRRVRTGCDNFSPDSHHPNYFVLTFLASRLSFEHVRSLHCDHQWLDQMTWTALVDKLGTQLEEILIRGEHSPHIFLKTLDKLMQSALKNSPFIGNLRHVDKHFPRFLPSLQKLILSGTNCCAHPSVAEGSKETSNDRRDASVADLRRLLASNSLGSLWADDPESGVAVKEPLIALLKKVFGERLSPDIACGEDRQPLRPLFLLLLLDPRRLQQSELDTLDQPDMFHNVFAGNPSTVTASATTGVCTICKR